MAFAAKVGNRGREHVLLFRHVRRMATDALRCAGLVPEPRIRHPPLQILVTIQAQLCACRPQHPGDVSTMRIMAGSTSADGKRAVGEAALELVLFVTLRAQGFRRLHNSRNASLGGDLMAQLAQVFFR